LDNDAVLRIDQEGLDVVVRLGGEIDLSNSAEVRDALVAYSGDTVIADCSRVTFMDVSALSSLIDAQQRIREDGGKFILFGVRPAQLRFLENANLTDYFDCMVPDCMVPDCMVPD
jgi:anti-anti-sigma factor